MGWVGHIEEDWGKVVGMKCLMLIVGEELSVERESEKGSVVTADQILTCVCRSIVLNSRYQLPALLFLTECRHLQELASLCPLLEPVLEGEWTAQDETPEDGEIWGGGW